MFDARKAGKMGMIMIDIDMPDNCDECRFNTEYGFCKAMPDNFCGNTDNRKKPEWCPLKEQEPKVQTVDQLEDALDTVVWLETPVSENLADGYSLIMAYSHKYGYMYFDSPFGDNPSQDRLEYSEYGRSWRCWDRRPSEEQRKAVKWIG